jgi:hypothetical protein
MAWIIGIFVTLYALLFIVWFYVGYHSGEVINKVSKTFKEETIKFLKSPNQIKKGN